MFIASDSNHSGASRIPLGLLISRVNQLVMSNLGAELGSIIEELRRVAGYTLELQELAEAIRYEFSVF